jgi:hypothetical protein
MRLPDISDRGLLSSEVNGGSKSVGEGYWFLVQV